MHQGGQAIRTIWPALAFLLAGVPLAALLDALGFFDALAAALLRRFGHLPVLALWVTAAVTTAVLNLDTTIVLLTPLFIRLARRSGAEPLSLALIPLLLAALASSALPVSNLTTLVAQDQVGFGTADVAGHLLAPTLAAVVVGWLAYRRRHPTRLRPSEATPVDRSALRIGAAIIAALLVAFTLGPAIGIQPWMAALAADVVLVAITRARPWRDIPVATALGVAAVAVVVALVVGPHWLDPVRAAHRPVALAGMTALAAAAANVVNNIPATLAITQGAHHMTEGMWAWLLGVDVGAVLLPIGALANILWRRILRADGLRLSVADHVRAVWPIALPSLLAAVLVQAVLAAAR